MHERIAVGRRGDENIWERGSLLRESQLRLAWKSIQDETASNPAVQLDTRPQCR